MEEGEWHTITLARHIEAELRARLFAGSSPPAAWPGNPAYTQRPESILVPGLDLRTFRADLERGQGGELEASDRRPPKFHAAHSSSALAVNTFGVFRRSPESLTLAGEGGFSSLEFEYPCPTGAGRGVANLDVLAQTDRCVVAVESKLCEFLRQKPAQFSPKYDRIVQASADRSWAVLFEDLKRKPDEYRHVDAAQLVKHYLGLRNKFANQKTVLVYLFWEPTNATRYDTYRVHAEEAAGVTERLAGSNVPVVAMRYSELWTSMARCQPRHVERLLSRYSFAVEHMVQQGRAATSRLTSAPDAPRSPSVRSGRRP